MPPVHLMIAFASTPVPTPISFLAPLEVHSQALGSMWILPEHLTRVGSVLRFSGNELQMDDTVCT